MKYYTKTMDVKLVWRILLKTSEKTKAEKIIKKIFARLGESSCSLRECKISLENPDSYELTLSQSLFKEVCQS